MDITFNCDKCGQSIVIDEAGAGQLVDCPKCGKPLEVPYKSKPPVPTAPPPMPAPRMSSPPVSSPLPVSDTKKCPFCAEKILAEARVCRFCGYDLVTSQPSGKVTESAQSKGESLLPKILAVVVLIAIMVGGFFIYNFWKDQQRAKAEAPFFAAAKEAVDDAHALDAALGVGLNYQAYGEKLTSLAAKVDKLVRAAQDTGVDKLKPEAKALCLSLLQVCEEHKSARDRWELKIKNENDYYYEKQMQEDWAQAEKTLTEADRQFTALKQQ